MQTTKTNVIHKLNTAEKVCAIGIVYTFYVCGVLLFVRIEQNIKICNTFITFGILQRILHIKIVREKLFSFYPENTYLFFPWCTVHGVTIKIA